LSSTRDEVLDEELEGEEELEVGEEVDEDVVPEGTVLTTEESCVAVVPSGAAA
jgi:hypothetical protein